MDGIDGDSQPMGQFPSELAGRIVFHGESVPIFQMTGGTVPHFPSWKCPDIYSQTIWALWGTHCERLDEVRIIWDSEDKHHPVINHGWTLPGRKISELIGSFHGESIYGGFSIAPCLITRGFWFFWFQSKQTGNLGSKTCDDFIIKHDDLASTIGVFITLS